MKGERKFTIAAIVFAVVVTLSGFIYSLNYAHYYTPQAILDDGYVLVHKDTFVGKMFSSDMALDVTGYESQLLSITGDVYTISVGVLEEIPGISPEEAKLFARVFSIIGAPGDGLIYMSRWFGDKFVGIDNYLSEEVFAFIIRDFNTYLMPVPYLTFFAQLLLIWGFCGVIGGIILRNYGEERLLDIKKYRSSQLAYKGLIKGEYVRVTDYVTLLLAAIIGPSVIIAWANNINPSSSLITSVIITIILAMVKINSPFKWVPVTGKKSTKTLMQTFTWRDKFAKKSHLFLAGVTAAFLAWTLYIKEFISQGSLFTWLDALMDILIFYLLIALAVRYWERFKYPGGRTTFSFRRLIPQIKLFKTTEEIMAENIIKEKSERDYKKRMAKNIKQLKEEERRKAQIEKAYFKQAAGESYYTNTVTGKKQKPEVNVDEYFQGGQLVSGKTTYASRKKKIKRSRK